MYAVIVEPPLNGATQVIVTLMLELTDVVGVAGASGFVIITAPFPADETNELPNALVAYILAKMLAPQGRFNGAACRLEIGTVQLDDAKMHAAVSMLYVTPSLCRISTM